jgi:hypothetical protein
MSRLPLFANVDTSLTVLAESGDLNNTTAALEFDVNQSGIKAAEVGDYVAAWANASASPDLDSNARVGKVTARSNTKLTVRWGEFGTPITAITGRAKLAVAFRGGDVDTQVLEQVGDLLKQNETARVADFTLALADSGKVNVINADGKVATLPSAATTGELGHAYIFEIGTDSTADGIGEIGFAISPASGDAIDGGGATGVNNKDVLVTKATARKGDRIVVTGGAPNKWVITHLAATITREA